MRTKYVVFALVILIASFSQIRAELPAPLIEVDTVFKIKTNGTKGVVFHPDGNSVIMMCQDTPYLIDANTWQVIRQFETKAGQETTNPHITKDGKYLITESGVGLAVWDIQSGEFIKYLRYGSDFCFSPDGTKLYAGVLNENSRGVICVYDMNTLEEIELFCNHNFHDARDIACSPDGNFLAVSVLYPSSDGKNNSVILIDLKNKTEYTEIAKIVPNASNLQFSPDGKYLMYLYSNNGNENDRYINIYNLFSKEITYIYKSELKDLFGYNGTLNGYLSFLTESQITFSYSKYTLVWDIINNKLKKIVNFMSMVPTIDYSNNKLLLCDPFGNLALLDLLAVSVDETQKSDINTISYANNQIKYYSDDAFAGDIEIFDLTGKSISNLGTQQIVIGENIIRVNQTIPKGIYILIINNGTEQYSYKFIAE